jgi:hypothetical protein
MNRRFETDDFPGRPRILFTGFPETSHTHSWIDLLQDARMNVRLFAMPAGIPPADWRIRTYVTNYYGPPVDPTTRALLYPATRLRRAVKWRIAKASGKADIDVAAGHWLAKIIRRWQPDIIHTFGVEQSGKFYLSVRRKFGLEGLGKWVLQTRGGSDIALNYLNPNRVEQMGDVLRSCDQLLSDNEFNFEVARKLGVKKEQFAYIAPVPGTGGIDVDQIMKDWHGPPSQRRLILWPKAMETPWGKMLPVLEALKMCWNYIQPCEVHMFSMMPDDFMWYWSLPEGMRKFFHTSARSPRATILDLMSKARVMLAPSLVDGIPNSMYEAMAAGAFPIVSPLDTIKPVVEHKRNVLFARNLYPEEIAQAITQAMTDDALVDSAATENLNVVRKRADRASIRPRVIEFYERLAAGGN